jgi:hypothetical protein
MSQRHDLSRIEARLCARPLRAAALLLPLALACSSSDAERITAVRVTAEWSGMQVDQLEYALSTAQGAVHAPERRPAAAADALASGVDIVIYLPDRLAGQAVDCRVTGYRHGVPQGSGQSRAEVVGGDMVEVRVTLPGGSHPDGGSPPDTGPAPDSGSADTADAGNPDTAPRRKPNGQSCSGADDCASGFCTDGVCCQQACDGACQACNLTGRLGTCSPRAAGTRCQAGTCSGNLLLNAGSCDGAGQCAVEASRSCGEYLCDPATATCRTRCGSAKDCAAPNVCSSAGRCGSFKALGTVCGADAECESGACVDGACCSSASCDFCYTCNLPGAAGTCRPVPDGSPEPNGLCPVQPVSNCGTDGTCNGQGACRTYPDGTICRIGRVCLKGDCR